MVNFGFSEEVSSDMWLECLDAWLESLCQFVRGRELTLEFKQIRQRQLNSCAFAGSHHVIQKLNKHLRAGARCLDFFYTASRS